MSLLFETLDVWFDEQARSGAENMAMDELLMGRASNRPLLRVYEWSEPTVSFGYFQSYDVARASFTATDLQYVRRWTGGGVVDHRVDLTYTLIIPRGHSLTAMRGAGSYCEIHKVLVAALNDLGVSAQLTLSDENTGIAACFSNPVAYDITDVNGGKIAGAGQRRNKHGLLHQGSVIASIEALDLFQVLAQKLAQRVVVFAPPEIIFEKARALARERYASDAWLRKN